MSNQGRTSSGQPIYEDRERLRNTIQDMPEAHSSLVQTTSDTLDVITNLEGDRPANPTSAASRFEESRRRMPTESLDRRFSQMQSILTEIAANSEDDRPANLTPAASRFEESLRRMPTESLDQVISQMESILNGVHDPGFAISQMESMLNGVLDPGFDRSSTGLSPDDPSSSAAIRFLDDLHMLRAENLPEESRSCVICTEPYITQTGEQNEEAVILPQCGHIFGHKCITTWLTPSNPHETQLRNTCPLCRDVLFDTTEASERVLANEDIDPSPQNWVPGEFLAAIEDIGNLADDGDLLHSRQRTAHQASIEHSPGDATSPSTTGDSALLISGLVLHFFRLFTQGTGADADQIAAALAHQMGRVSERLHGIMHRMRQVIPWDANGPPVSFLLDPAAVPLVELALERLVEVEEIWIESNGEIGEFEEERWGRVGRG